MEMEGGKVLQLTQREYAQNDRNRKERGKMEGKKE